jgi:hypothetical protein
MWRRKSVPAWLGDELVPEVHGRAPRAARTACHGAEAVAQAGGAKVGRLGGPARGLFGCGPGGGGDLHAGANRRAPIAQALAATDTVTAGLGDHIRTKSEGQHHLVFDLANQWFEPDYQFRQP